MARHTSRAWGPALIAALVVVVAAVVIVAVHPWSRGGGGHDAGPSSVPTDTSPPGSPGTITTPKGPTPPAHGAWVGASVTADGGGPQAKIDAFRSFESKAGRHLDIAHVYHPWDEQFPSASDKYFVQHGYTLLLSWAGTDTRTITSGRYDDMIRQRAREVKALGKPILLSWRGEMNRPNLQAEIWSAKDYVAAWKHIHKVFADEGATNVGWAWCPLAKDFNTGTGPAYYPGDDQVDWTCLDAYPGQDLQSFSQIVSPFLRWTAPHHKPVLIGEFGIGHRYGAQRAAWLRAAAQTIQKSGQIKALAYFDGKAGTDSGAKALSLEDTPDALAAFHDILAEPYFNPGNRPVAKQ